MIKLYNTLTRKVEEIQPLTPPTVTIYTCGPTVYDHAHIGNLSAYIFADTLRRSLQLAEYDVEQIMNYTDVDDKTIKRSRKQYPSKEPREALRELTDHYIQLFLEDIQKIGVDVKAITFMRATDSIEAMQQFITELHKKGFAYIADDGIYFSIEAYRKSGKTYGQLLKLSAGNTSEARIQNDEYDKESIHDFALWKKQKNNEPAWEFTLDGHDLTGRPGWHIECSTMSRQALGQPFDIHTGGIDLIFPHHENEIAQSTAGKDSPVMARCFAHNEHMLINGKKMAKSANNFYTLEDVIQKGFDPLAFRLLVLQAHYRSQISFSWENLEAAQNRLKRYYAWADRQFQPQPYNNDQKLPIVNDAFRDRLLSTIGYDLDTPSLLVDLEEVIEGTEPQVLTENQVENFKKLLEQVDDVLSLGLRNRSDIDQAQKDLIGQREIARESKNWAKSDQLRQELEKQGIGIKDTSYGAIWYRL